MKKENKSKNKKIKERKKECEKVFTNDGSKIIIKKNYNPLKVNYKIYEREGLYMEEKEKPLKEKNNNKKFINLLTKICLDLKVKDYKDEIRKFLAD